MEEKMSEIAEKYEKKKEANRVNNLRYAASGVEFDDIDAAYIDARASIGSGVRIGPCVTIEGATKIEADCVVGQGCYLKNARLGRGCVVDRYSSVVDSTIGAGASVFQSVVKESVAGEETVIGPFAYLRPGCDVGDRVKIGDFVEVKNARIGAGTKISHLSYIGDADLGEEINVGCGTVFVNYDGKEKHRSSVGDGAFIGCNANIVSPVRVGESAYIAAGTTVTRDVPSGSLVIGRTKERAVENWVRRRGLLRGGKK
jgi:bifunctional UDP-N-acetylglucosamine pyrophosphorylase/glucosamine-1-phosphate N-acetyltransferase